jgi:glycosyltransferase involved in cell wall biosynthesis
MKPIPVSVFVITQNEEKNITRLLESLVNFAEIIIVDSGSTDRTLEIAKSFGAKTYYQSWLGYSKQKEFAMSLCNNDWVLNLDADEALNQSIVSRIKEVITENKYDSIRFKRSDVFINKPLSNITKRPNNLRLYKKDKAFFNEATLVHESATVKGAELYVNEAFDHFGYNSINTLTDKGNMYSKLKSQEKFNKNKRSKLIKLVLVLPFTFFKKYFLQGFIFSGKRGFILSVITSYYAFSKEAKLFELEETELKK